MDIYLGYALPDEVAGQQQQSEPGVVVLVYGTVHKIHEGRMCLWELWEIGKVLKNIMRLSDSSLW